LLLQLCFTVIIAMADDAVFDHSEWSTALHPPRGQC
jgi:hypothetical protein